MRKDNSMLAMLGGLFVALFVLVAVVACNNTGGGATYYPHDHTHGYYDSHHHYHYYPKFKGGRVTVKPRPHSNVKPRTPSFRKAPSFSGRRR